VREPTAGEAMSTSPMSSSDPPRGKMRVSDAMVVKVEVAALNHALPRLLLDEHGHGGTLAHALRMYPPMPTHASSREDAVDLDERAMASLHGHSS